MSDKRNGYKIEDFKSIVEGDTRAPSFESLEAKAFLNNIAALGHSLHAVWGHALLPGDDRKTWAQFFLHVSDGSGYVAAYQAIHEGPPKIGRFAICEHHKVLGPNDRPNHSRGWHPGHCSKCGLDMTIDSGD